MIYQFFHTGWGSRINFENTSIIPNQIIFLEQKSMQSLVKVIGPNEWSKSTKIKKAITRIGSTPSNDIQITSSDFAPNHLQLHYLQETSSICKVLNLGPKVIFQQGERQSDLLPFAIANAQNGDEIVLGEYRIQFELPVATRNIQTSNVVEASLVFQDAIIRPDIVTIGRLSIENIGSQSACQFQVALSGLPGDCMQIDPVPLLFPGAQGIVKIRLLHHGLYPKAGFHELTVTISAPESYPGEQMVIQQRVYVAPVFEQSLEIIDDLTSATLETLSDVPDLTKKAFEPQSKPVTSVPSELPPVPSPDPAPLQPASGSITESMPKRGLTKAPKKVEEPIMAESNSASRSEAVDNAEVPVGTSTPDSPMPKIVRNPSENFWDEE
jgi:hypothetical protein